MSGKKAQLGTVVHKVMEVLASCNKKLQENPDKKSMYIKDDAIGKVNFTNRSLFNKEMHMN